MAEKTLLLVCEGETDIYIFEALAAHFSSPETQLTIISLAPQQDATSGTYLSHSFGHVLNWCAANYDKIEMLIDFRGASALFLQMDTDIAKQANCDCIDQGHSARHCCQERINQQLGAIEEPNRCHYILPTQNTETWLLAGHNFSALNENLNVINDFELITDTEQRLIAFGYASKKSKNGKKRKLNKTPAIKYKNHGKQLTDNLTLARRRCAELNRLCILLES